MRPQANEKSRICLHFSSAGLTSYCNREALIDLRDQLNWLIDSPPEEHYECHVLMTLENDESCFEGKRPRNAGLSISKDFADILHIDCAKSPLVDLTFMLCTETDLDKAQKHQK